MTRAWLGILLFVVACGQHTPPPTNPQPPPAQAPPKAVASAAPRAMAVPAATPRVARVAVLPALAWDHAVATPEAAPDHFEVQYDNGGWTAVGLPLDSTSGPSSSYSVSVASLTRGVLHTANIRACNATGCSELAVPFTFTLDPLQTSPDQTRVPPATSITDAAGAVWTIAADNRILKDGQYSNGIGSVLTWCGGKVRTYGRDLQWWVWTGTAWSAIGGTDPCTSTPLPTPVDCVVSAWSPFTVTVDWHPINATTEERTLTRTRTITTQPANGGAACPALTETTTETRPITTPTTAVITGVAQNAKCKFVLTASGPPDATGGWGIQFRRVSSTGSTLANIGQRDATAPYTRTTTEYAPGTYLFNGLWTKTGVASVQTPTITLTCGQ